MSYDVDVAGVNYNYTYNVSAVFYDHIPAIRNKGGLDEINGLIGRQALLVLSDAFDRLHKTKMLFWSRVDIGEPEFCAKYDADNGWGSLVGAMIFLGQIMGACARNPMCKVVVS
jgi:hypothetical protein